MRQQSAAALRAAAPLARQTGLLLLAIAGRLRWRPFRDLLAGGLILAVLLSVILAAAVWIIDPGGRAICYVELRMLAEDHGIHWDRSWLDILTESWDQGWWDEARPLLECIAGT